MTLKRSSAAANAGVATFDGQAMCEYAAKCPRLGKASADEGLNKQLTLQHRCLQRIIDQCLRCPKYIMPLHSELLLIDPDAKQSEDIWSGNYKSMAQIPKQWKIGFILGEAKRQQVVSVTVAYLAKVEAEDSSNISELFACILQLPETMTLPPGLCDGLTASRVFTARAMQVGDRLRQLQTGGGFGLEGNINYVKGGSFELTFKEGRCTHVGHTASKLVVEVPAHVLVTPSYTLHSNNLDKKPDVLLKPNRFQLCDLFADDAPFRQVMYNKGKKWTSFSRLVEDINARHQGEIEREELDLVRPDEVITQTAASERSRVNLARARDKLAERKREREGKHTVLLG